MPDCQETRGSEISHRYAMCYSGFLYVRFSFLFPEVWRFCAKLLEKELAARR